MKIPYQHNPTHIATHKADKSRCFVRFKEAVAQLDSCYQIVPSEGVPEIIWWLQAFPNVWDFEELVPPSKNSEWRQQSPQDQLTVLLMAMEGNLDNFQNGIIEKNKFLSVQNAYLKQLWELQPFLNGAAW